MLTTDGGPALTPNGNVCFTKWISKCSITSSFLSSMIKTLSFGEAQVDPALNV